MTGDERQAVVVIGAPGSGKSTVLEALQQEERATAIEIGELLREEVAPETRRGDEVGQYLEDGLLAPSDLVDTIVDEAVRGAEGRLLLFDGYPRNRDEVRHLQSLEGERLFEAAAVVLLHLSRETAIKRIVGRRTCADCGHTTNVIIRPPQRPGRCDRCGGTLEHRRDDHPRAAERRQDVYESETLPAMEELQAMRPERVLNVSAEGPAASVREVVIEGLAEIGIRLEPA